MLVWFFVFSFELFEVYNILKGLIIKGDGRKCYVSGEFLGFDIILLIK